MASLNLFGMILSSSPAEHFETLTVVQVYSTTEKCFVHLVHDVR